MKNLDLLISHEEILAKIQQVAQELNVLYGQEELVLVVVLKGALCLATDLLFALNNPQVSIECVQASSYGQKGSTRGELSIQAPPLPIQGKHVLLVDDIFDSGHTLTRIHEALVQQHPRSLKTLVLLEKKIARSVSFTPDYTLFPIENRFVIGYGLDYKEHYRGLKGIFAFQKEPT